MRAHSFRWEIFPQLEHFLVPFVTCVIERRGESVETIARRLREDRPSNAWPAVLYYLEDGVWRLAPGERSPR